MKVCTFGGIFINKNGVAEVNRDKCTLCRRCMSACPRNLIVDIPYAGDVVVLCSNKDKGAVAKNNCSGACIGCKLCEKNCPQEAIHVVDNVAIIDYSKCTSCGTCVLKCPRKVILNLHDNGKVIPVVKEN